MKTIISFFLAIFTLSAFSQENLLLNDPKNIALSKFLVKKMDSRPFYNSLSKDTVLSVGMKFNLDKEGIVDKVVAVWGNTPPLNEEYVRLLALTTGKWDKTRLNKKQTIFASIIIANPDVSPSMNKYFIERETKRLRKISDELISEKGKQNYIILEPIIIYVAVSN